jgi:phage-related protein
MTIATFSPTGYPDNAMDRTVKPRTIVHGFGDGYEQTASEGINTTFEEISPNWTNVNFTQGTYIINFLAARKGKPFYWQPNGEGPLNVYRCTEYTFKKKKGQYFDISAKLKQTAAA